MKLVIEDESGTRSVLSFATGEITVGRGAEANRFRLPDRDVSRRHARFLLVNGVPYVEDLGSLTGTRVNGERISARRKLREGDLVEIGDYDLAVVPDDGLAVVAGPGAPPPLPGDAPPAAPPPAPTPVAARAPAPAAAPARPATPPVTGGRFLLACAGVFLLALVVGLVVGVLTR